MTVAPPISCRAFQVSLIQIHAKMPAKTGSSIPMTELVDAERILIPARTTR